MEVLELIFWVCLMWVVYAFVGYPVVARALAAIKRRSVRKSDVEPTVTVVIAAFNEGNDIDETVKNKLAQNYPADKLSVVVISDESDDGTDEIVQSIDDDRVRLIRQSPRQGKTAALNLALPSIDSEIVVFSDANSQFEENAIRNLVRNFADDEVGYVTGKMIYAALQGNAIGDGCTGYMRFENWLRENETKMGSVVGVDGGIDAIRRTLYVEMNADQLPDFVLPLHVRRQGFRVVYEPSAVLVEEALDSGNSEFRMRVRVGLRALWALKDMSMLLNPVKFGLFAFQLWSHKLLRYLAAIPLLAVLFTNVFLSGSSVLYSATMIAQLSFYGLAFSTTFTSSPRTVQSLAYYFTLINAASIVAVLRFLRGQKLVVWNPRQGS